MEEDQCKNILRVKVVKELARFPRIWLLEDNTMTTVVFRPRFRWSCRNLIHFFFCAKQTTIFIWQLSSLRCLGPREQDTLVHEPFSP
jgi:hypothetical protein